MDFIVTMTSDTDYIALRHFTTVEELTNFVSKEGRIVIQPNNLYDSDFIHKAYGVDKQLADRMGKAAFKIEIYDDYRE